MDIFKLFFEHDLRLDELGERNTRAEPNTGPSIEDFMKPDPTYSKFYFTGTRAEQPQFGLSILESYPDIIDRLDEVFAECVFTSAGGSRHPSLHRAVDAVGIGEVILISTDREHGVDPIPLHVDSGSNVGHFKTELSTVLKGGIKVLYKENAHHGFDLHLFTKDNIYRQFFYTLKELIGDSFRFFSINGRRVRSERQFYFETWTLEKPPHGAEEVLPETVL